MEQEERKHQRRVRYRGTHPKRYEEKYKELQPEKYPETVAKVIQKGSTPVGMHIPIMVNEILDFLQIQPGQTGLDATLGYGGHTGRMLERLESKGHIYALDVDSIEMEKTRKRLENKGYGPEILTIRKLNFANIDQIVRESGPLDLRLDPLKGEPASERLKGLTREELTGMLIENSDEPYAEEIARAVMGEIKRGREVATTTRLYEMIDRALAFIPEEERKEAVKKSCQRTFQALRIDVNSEFEVLYEFLDKLPGVLKPGGRAAILTFHSGEDRIVKKSFKEMYRAGLYSQVATDVIRPTAEERRMNSRAHSTKMRWAVKA
uniref:16S rRNA (cytosine(1402)-N(4))-methyltransferase n=1 Tax=Enterocloster clostridioformis TaxID=1531 RepID=UPI0025A66CD2|nr:16S rRNA (cytosine(1402)-N(4))-methyltransferase [Enterocloster clostridioformis]